MKQYVSTESGEWSVKGFIDVYKNIYTISSDTKIISKILEIHIFSHIVQFAEKIGYNIILAEQQNYYPDLTFVNKQDERIFIHAMKVPKRQLECSFLQETGAFCAGIHNENCKSIERCISNYLPGTGLDFL